MQAASVFKLPVLGASEHYLATQFVAVVSVGVPQFPSLPILPSHLSATLYVEQVPNVLSQPVPVLKQLLIQL